MVTLHGTPSSASTICPPGGPGCLYKAGARCKGQQLSCGPAVAAAPKRGGRAARGKGSKCGRTSCEEEEEIVSEGEDSDE